jgi:hypothetical protein
MRKPTRRINDTFNNNTALKIIALVQHTPTPTIHEVRKLLESVGKIIRTNYVRRVDVVGLKKTHKIKSIEEGKTKARCKAGDIVKALHSINSKLGHNRKCIIIDEVSKTLMPMAVSLESNHGTDATVRRFTPQPNFAPHVLKQAEARINRVKPPTTEVTPPTRAEKKRTEQLIAEREARRSQLQEERKIALQKLADKIDKLKAQV